MTGTDMSGDAGPRLNRHLRLLAAGGLVAAAALLAAVLVVTDSGQTPHAPAAAKTIASEVAAAPSDPPAQVCGNPDVLDGPDVAPAGAVVVSTADDLGDLTNENPPGTTFWLVPGTHTIGTEPFSQVTPKAGDTYVGAPGAVLDGQRLARYAFTGYAADVSVKHLTVQNFGAPGENHNEGVVNHNSAAGWIIENNTISNNAGAGVMVGSGNVLRNNCLLQNGQYGFNAYHPDKVADVSIQNNEITGNNTDDWESELPGCGCTGGGKFWEVTDAEVRDNWVHDNNGAGLWADTNNVGFTIEGNYIADNDAEGVVYETSYNALIRSNTFVRNGLVRGLTNPGFPTSAVYVSESGSDARVGSIHSETFDISHNVFVDNWAGVILWENADRFAGSPANTSSGASTLVNPGLVTASTCTRANIHSEPYVDDCRWKTVNVQVHDNTFEFDPGEIGPECTSSSGCGYNGLFSNWGTYPTWSPYQKSTIQEAITFSQNNRFFENIYTGPWHFIVYDQGMRVDWANWQGSPYGQDGDSIIMIRTER